jgi:hypothetical protein
MAEHAGKLANTSNEQILQWTDALVRDLQESRSFERPFEEQAPLMRRLVEDHKSFFEQGYPLFHMIVHDASFDRVRLERMLQLRQGNVEQASEQVGKELFETFVQSKLR